MKEGERMARLVDSLYRDWQNGAVDQLPGRVSQDDAAEIARALQQEMDEGTAARARFAADNGLTIACGPGCSDCCENLIVVFEPEAIAVAQWLSEPENHEARDAFLDAYHRWRQAVGDAPERMAACIARGDTEGHTRIVEAVWKQRIMCAFNRDGVCSIYPVRPNVCRFCHALDTSEHCAATTQVPPQTVSFPALDRFMQRTRPLMSAAHIAVRGDREGPAPLCESVYRLLQTGVSGRKRRDETVKIGRNSPCPCGSGKKFKRCCGA